MTSWAMMGQAIEEGKGFLRIRLGPDGVLTRLPDRHRGAGPDYEISPASR